MPCRWRSAFCTRTDAIGRLPPPQLAYVCAKRGSTDAHVALSERAIIFFFSMDVVRDQRRGAEESNSAGTLTRETECVTMGHMKTITIRELHTATGKWVRKAGELGEVLVTERGRVVAKIVPAKEPPTQPYFSRRKFTRAFASIAPRLTGGTDSTAAISEGRDRETP